MSSLGRGAHKTLCPEGVKNGHTEASKQRHEQMDFPLAPFQVSRDIKEIFKRTLNNLWQVSSECIYKLNLILLCSVHSL